jgi:hypothetical protein
MRLHFLIALAAIAVFSVGCDTGTQQAAGGSGDHTHADGDDHGHDHGEEGLTTKVNGASSKTTT